MIHFNELRITPDGKNLIIEAEIDKNTYFDKVYIDKIIIDSQDTFSIKGPSSNPIYKFSTIKEEFNPKKVTLSLSSKDLGVDLNKSMLFVYVIASGTPAPDTPCGYDNSTIMKSVVNLQNVYRRAMSYIRELNSYCSIPKNFIDSILVLKAFELCIKTGDYIKAIKIWNKNYQDIECIPSNKCVCNG